MEGALKSLDHQEVVGISIMAVVGIIGGIVRVCNDNKDHSIRSVVGSLLASGFAGGIVAALLHDSIVDPIMLSAVTGMSGYCSSIILAILSKWIKDKFGGFHG